MNTLTINNTVLKTQQPEFTTQSARKQGLVAKWFTVNGELVCKWFPA